MIRYKCHLVAVRFQLFELTLGGRRIVQLRGRLP